LKQEQRKNRTRKKNYLKIDRERELIATSNSIDQEKESPNQSLCHLCRYIRTKFFTQPFRIKRIVKQRINNTQATKSYNSLAQSK
jgi:hypothetical protein